MGRCPETGLDNTLREADDVKNVWLENKWLPRGLGWLAVGLSFMAGVAWNGGVSGYITLGAAVFIIWNVVKSSVAVGVLETYRKTETRI